MQNLIKYTSYFKPLEEYGHKFIGHTISSIREYNKEVERNPIPEKEMIHREWEMPFAKPLLDRHYEVLFTISTFFKVKLMWRNYLGPNNSSLKKGIRIIGTEYRVLLFEAFANYFFKGQAQFEVWVRVHDTNMRMSDGHTFSNIRQYASHLVAMQEDMLITFMKNTLEYDRSYNMKLEGYIKERYKLDYKNYKTDKPEYYHAISKRFHHKRMIS